MEKKTIFICKYAPVLMKIARKIMRYFLLFPLFFFRFFYFHFIHSISASVEMLHVSMHVLQHESVIKLHFVPETFYCYFLLLWLMAVCNMLSFVYIYLSIDMYAWRIMIIIMNYKRNEKGKFSISGLKLFLGNIIFFYFEVDGMKKILGFSNFWYCKTAWI